MNIKSDRKIWKAFKEAFPHTLPICAGFLFLGMSYGFLMKSRGFGTLYPLFMSIFIFAGSMEFVAVNLLLSAFNPLYVFLLTLMVNARHLFYGIAMLDRYRGMGWKKPYLIFGLCDETFAVNCTATIPEDTDSGWFMFAVTFLNQCYWVTGTLAGSLLGNILAFNTEGLDFVMTAMFVVIFMDQWLKEERHISSLLGLGISFLCLLAFGADNFIIPSMIAILGVLTFLRKPLEKGGEIS